MHMCEPAACMCGVGGSQALCDAVRKARIEEGEEEVLRRELKRLEARRGAAEQCTLVRQGAARRHTLQPLPLLLLHLRQRQSCLPRLHPALSAPCA